MANFQFIVSDPKTRKAYKIEVDQTKAAGIVGKSIGDSFNGDIIGLAGYQIQITGGTDKDGFPMHPQVHGPGRKKIILSHPPGFHPKIKGQRRRKMVRGNTISASIVQINCKVVKSGSKNIEDLLPKGEKPSEEKKEESKPEEKPKSEEKKQEKPKEEKKEEKPEKEPKKEEKKQEKPEEKKEPVKSEKKSPEKSKKEGEEVSKESKS